MIDSKEKKILIVDDNEINIDILYELLEEYFDILSSTNGKDALETINNNKIDLILLDIMMPDINGYEISKILKSNPETSKIPIIIITAKTKSEIDKLFGNLIVEDYITKPFDFDDLLEKIKKLLNIS